jgi:hypothetical protein
MAVGLEGGLPFFPLLLRLGPLFARAPIRVGQAADDILSWSATLLNLVEMVELTRSGKMAFACRLPLARLGGILKRGI